MVWSATRQMEYNKRLSDIASRARGELQKEVAEEWRTGNGSVERGARIALGDHIAGCLWLF